MHADMERADENDVFKLDLKEIVKTTENETETDHELVTVTGKLTVRLHNQHSDRLIYAYYINSNWFRTEN